MDNNIYSYLDKIRQTEGNEKCIEVFDFECLKNRWGAIDMINDHKLSFPCLYILLDKIKAYGLFRQMVIRNNIAIKVVNQITLPNYSGEDLLFKPDDRVLPVLKWIFNSGNNELMEDDTYEQAIDISASVILNVYKDRSILSDLINLIFERYKRGRNIHDLIWACFKTKDPETPMLILERVRSNNMQEVNLAKQLLNISEDDNSEHQYDNYLKWFKENDEFLYFSDESFQYSSAPNPIKADVERKYLNKGIASYDMVPLSPTDQVEMMCLNAFKQLNEVDMGMLSDYSLDLHKKDIEKWRNWIKSPIEEQIKAAKDNKEGRL